MRLNEHISEVRMISTDEAAKRLGVTRRRVQELVSNGSLSAQKVSGVWLVDEESVAKRNGSVSKRGGRPARGKGKNDVRFELMNREHEIMPVVYDTARKEFTLVGELADARRAPV